MIRKISLIIICCSIWFAAPCQPTWTHIPLSDTTLSNWKFELLVNTYKSMYVDKENRIYVSGEFDSLGKIAAHHIGYYQNGEWHAMESGIPSEKALGASALTYAEFQGKLYVGGWFYGLGDKPAYCIGIWDGTKWDTLYQRAFTDFPDKIIYTMKVINNELWVGGNFDSIAGIRANGLAKFDGKQWHSVNLPIHPSYTADYPHINNSVRDIAYYKGKVYIAGILYVGPPDVGWGAAVLENGTWKPLQHYYSGGTMYKIIEYRDELYFAGRWQHFENNVFTVYSLRKWNGETWSNVGNTTYIQGISDMEVFKGKLYIVGGFQHIGPSGYYGEPVSLPCYGIVSWDGEKWCNLNRRYSHYPMALAKSGDGKELYVLNHKVMVNGHRVHGFISKFSDANYPCNCWEVDNLPEPDNIENEIILYPNPTHSQFSLEFKNIELPDFQAQVKIFNVLGQEVHNQMLFEVYPYTQHTLNVGYLRAGSYFVQINAGDKRITKKLVVTR